MKLIRPEQGGLRHHPDQVEAFCGALQNAAAIKASEITAYRAGMQACGLDA